MGRYQRALEADSSLAFAAFKGALAANWLERDSEAVALVARALQHPNLLPPKYLDFATGLRDYLAGSADSAATDFDRALARDSGWVDAWAARGEVYYHLAPAADDPLAIAEASFQNAFERDSAFSPPLFHLTELAVRRGALVEARRYLGMYRRASLADFRGALDLMVECATSPMPAEVWTRQAAREPEAVKEAARSLAVGGRHFECAEAASRALLSSTNASDAARWSALLGLHNLLVAEGRMAASSSTRHGDDRV